MGSIKFKARDIWIMAILIVVGMSLVFVILSTESNALAHTVLGFAIGIFLLAIGFGIVKPAVSYGLRRKLVEYEESASIPKQSRIEIVFRVPVSVKNPRLTLIAKSRNLMVDEVWHNGCGTLQLPQPAANWHKGIYYSGKGPVNMTLLISNSGRSTAHVTARLVGLKERT